MRNPCNHSWYKKPLAILETTFVKCHFYVVTNLSFQNGRY